MLSNLRPATFPASAPLEPRSGPIPAGFEPLSWASPNPGESRDAYRERIEFRRSIAARTLCDVARRYLRGGPEDRQLLALILAEYDAADAEYRCLLGFPANEG